MLRPITIPSLFPYTTLFRSAAHRSTEIQHFIKLSNAVGYAIPEHLGDFSFRELAKQIQQEHDSLRWVFVAGQADQDRKSTRLNSSHVSISYAVFCLKKKSGL